VENGGEKASIKIDPRHATCREISKEGKLTHYHATNEHQFSVPALQVRQQGVGPDGTADQEDGRRQVLQADLNRVRVEDGLELQREEVEESGKVHSCFNPREGSRSAGMLTAP
jgi:hypothetical protein